MPRCKGERRADTKEEILEMVAPLITEVMTSLAFHMLHAQQDW